MVTRAGFSRVSFRINVRPAILITILSVGLYIPLQQLETDVEFFTFFVKGSIATVLMVAGIYIIDDKLAALMRQTVGKLFNRQTG